MPTEAYVYWRTGLNTMDQALGAATALQQTLRNLHPGLQTRLLRRAVETDKSTVMEIYRHPAGVGPALLRSIEQQAALHLASLPQAPIRHVELFELVEAPPTNL